MLLSALVPAAGLAKADSQAPWGRASEVHQSYVGQKVVFDTTAGSVRGLTSVLDRAGHLSMLNSADHLDTRIVIVVHGDAIPFFATRNYGKQKALMQRAQSLSLGEVIEFRLCKAAAALRGYRPEDFHGFIKLVPMADAEIARLQQQEGFAYMR